MAGKPNIPGAAPPCWLVLGAGSAMARAFVRALAARGEAVVLCGRDLPELQRLAADAALRGAPFAQAQHFDCRDPESFTPLLALAGAQPGALSVAVFTGSMPAQADIDADPSLIDGVMADNHTGPARLLQMLAPLLEARGQGTVIGVSSVAGDRGRLPNYVYGASKAAFSTYLSGLRNRLGRSGVHVVTAKPGPVDTAMTWGLPGVKGAAAPEDVARALLSAADRRRNVVYTPFKWRIIMTVIGLIPEAVFKKLKF